MRKFLLKLFFLSLSAAFSIPAEAQDTASVNNLVKRGFKYISLENGSLVKRAKECLDSALMICKNQNLTIPPELELLRGEYYFATGNYRSAEDEVKNIIQEAESSGDDLILGKAMLFMGKYYVKTGFFQESIDYYNRVIDLANKRKLKGLIPKAYLGLSFVNIQAGDTEGLRKNFRLMIGAASAEKDSTALELAYIRLGTSFTEQPRDFRKADSLIRKGLAISGSLKDTFWLSFSLANIGWNFYAEKMYDSSLVYYNKSLKYSIPGKQFMAAANSLGNIGTINRDLGHYEKALNYYRQSLEQANKVHDYYTLSWVYLDMSNMYLMKQDTGRAYETYISYKKFSDSLLIQRNSQGMMNAKIRYEADSHNKEVQLLSLKIKNQRILNYAILGSLVLTLAIMILLLSRVRIKSRQRISEMNRKISEITQANLRQQMNPHFIFNTLNSIQYYMYQHDKLATNNYLTKFSSLMRKVLENSQHTSVRLQDELDALQLYLELESLRFRDKFEYEINVDDDIDTLVFKVPTMLIQPYVENSITHGLMPREEKGFVRIDLKLENKHIQCIIEDNGIGREASQENRRLRNENHNSFGTQITSSRLDLVNSLYGTSLRTTYTDLVDSNGKPSGTRVEIHIPILT